MAGRLAKLPTLILLCLCAAAWLATSGVANGTVGARPALAAPLGGVNIAGVAGNLPLSLADREIARARALHAKLVSDGKRWKVVDQLSANGTFVNGKRCNVSYLAAGDRIAFGSVECTFQLPKGGAADLFGAITCGHILRPDFISPDCIPP